MLLGSKDDIDRLTIDSKAPQAPSRTALGEGLLQAFVDKLLGAGARKES